LPYFTVFNFKGLAGSAAATGIGPYGYELSAGPWNLIILGYFFVPCYISAGVCILNQRI